MNERIKALLVQCTQESIDGPFATPYVNQEKFAELIVEECANWIDVSSPIKLGAALQKHFGVDK